MKDLETEGFDQKLAQLKAIQKALDNALMTGPKPREYLQLASAFAAAMIGMSLAGNYFEDSGYGLALTMASTVIGGIVGLMAFDRFVPAPRPALEILDDLITEYEPVHERAYASLQRSVINARSLTNADIGQWIEREHEAIKELMPVPQGPGTKFMNKALPTAEDNDSHDDGME